MSCFKEPRQRTGKERMREEHMKIEMRSLMKRLEEIYACGAKEDQTHTRMAYSPEDRKGRDLFLDYAAGLGLLGRMDEAGNLFVRLEGKDASLPSILIGSHLDTVPDGGKYDGVLGCLAGLGVLEAYTKAGKRPNHTIEAVVYTDEEGFRFGKGLLGSSALCGLPLEICGEDLDIYGERREDVMEKAGCKISEVMKAKREKESVCCSLELHIEQGASLDRHKIPVGVVSSIAGISRYEITVRGEANHAGSTVMSDRKDALVAASTFISQVPKIVEQWGNTYTVATVGTIRVTPHSVNVIPGTCTFSLEIRDQDEAVMDLVEAELRKRLESICREQGEGFTWEKTSCHPPAPMTGWVREQIEKAVKSLGYPYEVLPSGAFHDSLIMSSVFPTGMIFVPSAGGISHSRTEYTREEDIEKGCDVLMQTVLEIDGDAESKTESEEGTRT